MTPESWPKVSKGERLSARAYNELQDFVRQLVKSTGPGFYFDDSGFHSRPLPPPPPPRGMIPVRCWQDGGYIDGDVDNQCDRTYTVRSQEATAIDAGGELLGEHMVPRTRQATAYKCQMDCPPAEGGGWIGIGYEDENGAFALFDSGERPVTVAYESCPNCEPEGGT